MICGLLKWIITYVILVSHRRVADAFKSREWYTELFIGCFLSSFGSRLAGFCPQRT